MRVLAWLTDGTWEACVDAARDLGGEVTLLYVVDADTMAAMSGPIGLLGRSGSSAEEMLADAGSALLDAAASRLNSPPAARHLRWGRPEREVVAACDDTDLLVLARDGDLARLGPRSLGHHTRFVVDHAPCRVLVVWPEATPGLSTMPPPPHHRPH